MAATWTLVNLVFKFLKIHSRDPKRISVQFAAMKPVHRVRAEWQDYRFPRTCKKYLAKKRGRKIALPQPCKMEVGERREKMFLEILEWAGEHRPLGTQETSFTLVSCGLPTEIARSAGGLGVQLFASSELGGGVYHPISFELARLLNKELGIPARLGHLAGFDPEEEQGGARLAV